jgi:hypothetical protein
LRLSRKSRGEYSGSIYTITVTLIQARCDGGISTGTGFADCFDAAREHVQDIGRGTQTRAIIGDVVAARRVSETDGDEAIEDARRL